MSLARKQARTLKDVVFTSAKRLPKSAPCNHPKSYFEEVSLNY
jgi:hypothetical protein